MFRHTLAAALLAATGAAHAEAVVYDFQDFWGDILAAGSTPAHLRASQVTIGNAWGGICWNTDVGVTDDFACGGFGSSALSFSVTADAGWQFDINSFTFQGLGVNADHGPTGYAVYSSLDGFTNALIGGSLGGQTLMQRYDYDAGVSAQDLTGPFELRIVSTGRDALPASAWLLDNLRLDVTVERIGTVPEPGSLALAAAALFAGGAARRRASPRA
jgi:PEP-CTERM motif